MEGGVLLDVAVELFLGVAVLLEERFAGGLEDVGDVGDELGEVAHAGGGLRAEGVQEGGDDGGLGEKDVGH